MKTLHQRSVGEEPMAKWKILDKCPKWPLRKCIGSSSGWNLFINSGVELFSETYEAPITHAHFYTNIKTAKKWWRSEAELRTTLSRHPIKTVSFEKPA